MDTFGSSMNFLKTHKDAPASLIADLINLSLKYNIIPKTWKTARATPIHKAGDQPKPENYRPISILPSILKVTEKWVAAHLISHLNNGSTPLHLMQLGFRKNHSSDTATISFLED